VAGLQARHDEEHDYLPEKLSALEVLFRVLDAPEIEHVIPLVRSADALRAVSEFWVAHYL